MNIKIILMLATIVLAASVATMTIASKPAFAVKHPDPHNHGASLTGSENDELFPSPPDVICHYDRC
jgi:hypothetical protein